jgi:SAM-dependent methyltransferase
MKLFSGACERNRAPILARLIELELEGTVLEIAAGTGMHAAWFAPRLTDVLWQPTDRTDDALESIAAWRAESGASNLLEPLRFDLLDDTAPIERADAIFNANMIHVAPEVVTERLFLHAAALLGSGSPIVLYGPYRYEDRPLEPSNARFHESLQQRYEGGGIKLFEWVDSVARAHGFEHADDFPMPANNRLQIWRKLPADSD